MTPRRPAPRSQTYLSHMKDGKHPLCVHGGECFPNWHRVYMLDFEQTLRCADIDLGGDGNIGLPYWDWSIKPEGKTMLPMLAQKLMAQTIGSQGQVCHMGGSTRRVERADLSLASPQGLFPDDFLPLTRGGHPIKANEPDGTPFYKTMARRTPPPPPLTSPLQSRLAPLRRSGPTSSTASSSGASATAATTLPARRGSTSFSTSTGERQPLALDAPRLTRGSQGRRTTP